MKYLIFLFLFSIGLQSACIEKHELYRTIAPYKDNKNHYKILAISISKLNKVSQQELKKALSPQGEGDLHNLFFALANDEVNNCDEMEKYASLINDSQILLELYPEAGLDLIDMWLRLGRYEAVITALPKSKILRMKSDDYQRANYYVAIAKHLSGSSDHAELEVAKNKYQKAREIYRMRYPNDALYRL